MTHLLVDCRGFYLMSTHGAAETQRLKLNVQDQLNRLLQQLTDLEELRDELDDEEYTETRRDTLEQMEVRSTAGCPEQPIKWRTYPSHIPPIIFSTARRSSMAN